MTSSKKKVMPLVSVCTPTFNRRPFIQTMFECFRNQDYPKHRIEWIIVDDGTDKIKDLVESSNIPQIRYFEVEEKMKLGAKRNYMHKYARGSIIVYMDDDDYYPPDRISHAVERLQSAPNALCAGSSEIYIYYKQLQKMYQCGPYGPNHATAGTFAFRSELLKITKYEETASLAEERAFLKEYTIPFVQLDPMKTILVFSHEHNTFDKRKMLDNPHPDYCKESPKTVDMFIKTAPENKIKQFFLQDIDKLLLKYEPGLPKMKPDVLIQMKQIEEERKKYIEEEMKKRNEGNSPFMIQRPGEEPVQLSNQDVVQIMQQQQSRIVELQTQLNATGGGGASLLAGGNHEKKTAELENMVSMLQKRLIEKINENQTLAKEIAQLKQTISLAAPASLPSPPTYKVPIEIVDSSMPKPKSEPEVSIDFDVDFD
jgi:hypothetical protein